MRLPAYITALFLIIALMVTGCGSKSHFITNRKYRKQVQTDFEARRLLAHHRDDALFGVFEQDLTLKEKEALQFLFAYMPLADLAEYDGAFFLGNVRHSFMTAGVMPWGTDIPDDVFRHYVLPVRVNNENLDSARWVFFDELKERVSDLTLEEAALEVNRWCHEKVTYRASDGRTSAPLSTMKNAYGRCGEESVFTVAALRSVGIPARQVYVPRWAHCDDNHAWVEVWVEGAWHYMGACEPEPVLDRGWFTGPSKRAMLVHTRVFGRYQGNEEVVTRERDYAVINATAIYTDIARPVVTVVDRKGKLVPDAKVEFGLYNYAEFYPIATLTTDDQGRCTISIGKGDIVLHATDGTRCTWSKHDLRTDTIITLTLNPCLLPTGPDPWHLDVPDEVTVDDHDIPKEMMAEHKARLAREDSLRNAYVKTFPAKDDILILAETMGNLHADSLQKYLTMSQGNHREITAFLQWMMNEELFDQYREALACQLFRLMTEKDMRDTRAATLKEVIQELPSALILKDAQKELTTLFRFTSPYGLPVSFFENRNIPDDLFFQYLFSPKIDLELLKPHKKLLNEYFTAILGDQPDATRLFIWVRDSIVVDTTPAYSRIIITPAGVHNLRVADPYSRNIYFVAACRSMGFPARLEPVTQVTQVWIHDHWKDFSFGLRKDAEEEEGTLSITSSGNEQDPAYFSRFTIARLMNGRFMTLQYPWDKPLSQFTFPLSIKPGMYALTSGLRQPDGDVDVLRYYFTIESGTTTTFSFPVPEMHQKNYGIWPATDRFSCDMPFIFLLLETTGEPSRHLLQELQHAFQPDACSMPPVYVMFDETDGLKSHDFLNRYKLTGKVTLVTPDMVLEKLIQHGLSPSEAKVPVAAGVNVRKEIVFLSGGYQIGSIQRIRELLTMQ